VGILVSDIAITQIIGEDVDDVGMSGVSRACVHGECRDQEQGKKEPTMNR